MAYSKERFKQYLLDRYHQRRSEAVVKLGGKCVRCSSSEGLELDHIDRASKSYDVANMCSYSDEKYWAEIAKCQLLCSSCHAFKTIDERGHTHAEHGTNAMYSGKHRCRCTLCKQAHAEVHQKWRAKKAKGAIAHG